MEILNSFVSKPESQSPCVTQFSKVNHSTVQGVIDAIYWVKLRSAIDTGESLDVNDLDMITRTINKFKKDAA